MIEFWKYIRTFKFSIYVTYDFFLAVFPLNI